MMTINDAIKARLAYNPTTDADIETAIAKNREDREAARKEGHTDTVEEITECLKNQAVLVNKIDALDCLLHNAGRLADYRDHLAIPEAGRALTDTVPSDLTPEIARSIINALEMSVEIECKKVERILR